MIEYITKDGTSTIFTDWVDGGFCKVECGDDPDDMLISRTTFDETEAWLKEHTTANIRAIQISKALRGLAYIRIEEI